MIPAIIHQYWSTVDTTDYWDNKQKAYGFSSLIKKCYPDCKHIIWTDAMVKELVDNSPYTAIKDIWYKVPIGAQSDITRYLILYLNGGIWMDLDILCKKRLPNLVHNNQVDFIGYKADRGDSWITGNAFFAVTKKSNIMANILYNIINDKNIKNNNLTIDKDNRIKTALRTLYSTGPEQLHRTIESHDYITSYYSRAMVSNYSEALSNTTHLIHLMGVRGKLNHWTYR